jgi:hypothetical protein
MAIQDENNQAQAQSAQQEPKANFASDRFSFHSNNMFAPIPRGVGTEAYTKLKTNLTEVFKSANPGVEIALIDMDNATETNMFFGSIIVAARLKDNDKVGVAYHVLLLEATGDKLTPIFENVNGQQIEILRVSSDAIDDELLKRALEKVRNAFPRAGNWYLVDGTVLPESFNADDKVAVHQLALNAGLACTTELQIRVPGFKDLNLATLANDSSLNVNIQFGRSQVLNAVGKPLRADVLVNFASKRNTNNGKYASVNSGDKEVRVSEIAGYLDLVWAPVNAQAGYNPYQQQVAAQTQRYASRLVVTNLASNYSYTPGSVLLAMSTALTLRDDSNWIQGFRPMPSIPGEQDMTDIGALNYEANILNEPNGGTYIDTKASDFKLEDLGQLVTALIQPGLIISLDCPEQGPQSWYTSVFAAASNGSQAAYNVLYEAAQQLTNNSFGRYFPLGTQMFVDQGNRVHMGTWVDRQGNVRDIRDFDHVAVCNLVGERNPGAIREYSDTYQNTRMPLIQRLFMRKRIITSLSGETAKFTGFAQRVTFSAAFMDALSRGIRDTNMAVRVNTPLSSGDFNNQRGVATYAGAALLAPGNTYAPAAGGYNGQQQHYGMNQGYGFTRW